jgi:Cep192 domain 4
MCKMIFCLLAVGVFACLAIAPHAAATTNHYVYVIAPGAVYVYDMDNSFALVKSVAVSQLHTLGATQIRGVVASATSGMMYITYGSTNCTGGSMLKYDLTKDTVVWAQNYSFGIDSMSISPDGSKIYMPIGESCLTLGTWEVIDANTGSPIGQLNSGGLGPHNTITNLSGTRIYMDPRRSDFLVVGDTSTLTPIRTIGPFSSQARPFTINAEETYAFTTISGSVGFYVSDINTGNNLFWVCPPGYCWTSGSYNGISGVAHGISLSPDEAELYLIDLPYNRVHVFDPSPLPGSPPVDVADIPLSCKLANEGWLQHSRDGRFVFVGDCGDVIDTSTRKVVANMPQLLNTRIWNEVDFVSGVPSFSPLSRNQGGYGAQQTSGPSVSLSSTSVAFGNQTVATKSSAKSVTVTNSGNASLSITGITIGGTNSGDFAQTNNCGSSLAAGANCAINVTFTAGATGARSGSLSIADNASGSPQVVALTGTGVSVTTTVTVAPVSLAFGSQAVGTTSAAQSVTLSNTGSAALSISGITVSANFAQTNNCGSSLAAGGNCKINVTFSPSMSTNYAGSLTITDNAGNSPQSVTLTGAGGPVSPAVTVTPGSLTFGSQALGTTSAGQSVTLANTGTAALSISGITASANFAQANNCGSSLAVGGNCKVTVTFSPSSATSYNGSLTITDNAGNSPQSVTLTGTGTSSSGNFSLTPSLTSLTLAPGHSSTFPLNVTPTGGFNQAVTLTCTSQIPAGSCAVSPSPVTPTGSTAASATVSITTMAAGSAVPGERWVTPATGVGRGILQQLIAVLAIMVLLVLLAQSKRRAPLALGFMVLLVMLVGVGCAGVTSSSGTGGTTPATPAGSYTLTLTGTSGSGANALTHSVTVTLTVN